MGSLESVHTLDREEVEMIDKKHSDWQAGDPETARTLPSRFFYDPGIFDREADTIFYSSWHCVCHDMYRSKAW